MQGIPLGPGGEFRRIEMFIRAVSGPERQDAVALPLGDDAAAVLARPGESIVVSSDLSVEDVHFRREWLTWTCIGYRATAAALSDLAAVAARPVGVLVSLALAPELDDRVYEELAWGIGDCLRGAEAALLGGDLSRSPGPAALDVVAVGAARTPVGRAGAAAGHELWVTGTLGGAAAAAAAWKATLEPDLRARKAFERPVPRIAEARWLADRAEISALIDLSDGLAGDAGHVAAASGVRLELETAVLPLHAVLEEYADRDAAVRLAVGGGEDYELLMTVPPGSIAPLADEFERVHGARLTRIGRVTEGAGVVLVDEKGREREVGGGGFDHFGGE